jgi:hypothetical protein
MRATKRVALLGFLVAALVLVSYLPAAATTSLAPGGTVAVPIDNTVPGAGYTVIASIIGGTFTSTPAGAFHGTYETDVIREATGTLDFFYRFTNVGPDPIITASVNNFDSFTTSVGANNTFGGLFAPSTASRDGDGSTISFGFAQGVASNSQLSDYFYVVTNATNFTSGFFNLIDGGVSSNAAFAPTAAPIPPSALLLGTGLLGLVGFRRFRKS